MPTIAALESDDTGLLASELQFLRLRSQVAVVRALADHVEHLARPGACDGLADQLVEEMARLGDRLLEATRSRSMPVAALVPRIKNA